MEGDTIASIPAMQLTPKGEFLLVPRQVTMQDGTQKNFLQEELVAMLSSFKALGRKLVIDYEHQTLGSLPKFRHFMSPDGKTPAAGWIEDMAIGEEGIIAKRVKWVGEGEAMVSTGKYLYMSPTIFFNDAGRAIKLGPVALTNDPLMNGMPALAAKAGVDAPMPANQLKSRQDLHEAAMAWAAKHGVSYASAVESVGSGQLSPEDPVSHTAAFQLASPERQQLHRDCLAYMQAHKCDYSTAFCQMHTKG